MLTVYLVTRIFTPKSSPPPLSSRLPGNVRTEGTFKYFLANAFFSVLDLFIISLIVFPAQALIVPLPDLITSV